MPRRFKLFPRYRKPSVNELLGITQARRRVSRKLGLATLRDPRTPIRNLERRMKRRAGYYSEPMKAARRMGLLTRGGSGCLVAALVLTSGVMATLLCLLA